MDAAPPEYFSNRRYFMTPQLAIPHAEVSFRTSRGGGPGGQHVNKTETKVELLFDVAHSPTLTDDQRARLLAELRSWLDDDGVLHLVSHRFRSQFRNREDTVARFIDLVRAALRPRKVHKRTTTPRAAREQRLQAKKQRGAVKRLRGKSSDAE